MTHEAEKSMIGRISLAVLAVCLVVLPALAQPTRHGVLVPDRNDDGNWYGSWAYTSRHRQMGLFIRNEGNGPEVKLVLQSLTRPERFETDWSGRASYFLGPKEGRFELTFDERDENTLRGTWYWKSPIRGGHQIDRGAVEIFRSVDGRSVVFHFPEYIREKNIEGRPPQSYGREEAWTFRKVSKRVVRFEELPF